LLITGIFGLLSLKVLDMYSLHFLTAMLAATILIDADHVIHFGITQKVFSFRKFVKHEKHYFKTKKPRTLLFHSIEFNVILFYLGLANPLMMAIFLATSNHVVCDIISHYKYHRSIEDVKDWVIHHNFIPRILLNPTPKQNENIY
jgi:predicted cation transporter